MQTEERRIATWATFCRWDWMRVATEVNDLEHMDPSMREAAMELRNVRYMHGIGEGEAHKRSRSRVRRRREDRSRSSRRAIVDQVTEVIEISSEELQAYAPADQMHTEADNRQA